QRDSPVANRLRAGYERILARVVRRPQPALMAAAVIVLAGLVVLPRLGEALFPTFKERDFLIHWITKPGTTDAEEVRIATTVSNELRAIPGVRNFGSHIGRATQGEEVVDVNAGENWISVDPSANYDKTLANVQKVVAGYPGLYRDVQ